MKTMLSSKKSIRSKASLLFVALFTLGSAFAQKTTPDHVYNAGGKIEFTLLTDAGVLLVAGAGGLVGIKPGASQPHFTFKEYGKIKQEELEVVPLSPYAIVTQGGKSQIPGTLFANSKRSVIDIITGQKLFATEDKGWKQVAQLKVFLPENKLVVVGNRTKKEDERLAVGIYDLATGNQDGFAILDKFQGKVRSAAAIPMSSGAPFLSGDRVYVPTNKATICANVKNGEILWEAKVDKLTWMLADETGNEIYGFEERANGDTRIHKFSKDGQPLWNKERKIQGTVTRFQILPQGLAVVSDVFKSQSSALINRLASGNSESKIAFLNASTGEDLWDKAPKTKGFVQHFFIMEDGILFGLHNGGINKISFDGKPLFKKPLSTGENIHTMAQTPKGLIYITDTDAGIVDLKTGDPVWKKPIKYAKAKAVSSAYDQARNRYLISTGSEILAIDENTADVTNLAKFSLNEKESATEIDIRDAGLLLTSNQNLLMLDFGGGKELFHTYHKSPGQSTFTKIAMGVVTVAAAATAAAAASQSNYSYSLGNYSSAAHQRANNNARAAAAMEAVATASFNEMVKRFKATASTENSQFILTTLDGGVGLVKVNKDSGKTEKEIVLKDKKPVYDVDDWGGYLYYRSGNDEISAYRL